jgi:hypothetical protein
VLKAGLQWERAKLARTNDNTERKGLLRSSELRLRMEFGRTEEGSVWESGIPFWDWIPMPVWQNTQL